MKVSVELSKEYVPPYAVIYTDIVTDEIQRAIELLSTNESPIIAQMEDRFMIIRPDEVYMIRVENKETVIYTEKEHFYSRKRLYEVQEQLGAGLHLQLVFPIPQTVHTADDKAVFILDQLKFSACLSQHGIFVSGVGGGELAGGKLQDTQPYRDEHFFTVIGADRGVVW